MDDRLEEEAVRRGVSKAALIRQAVVKDLGPDENPAGDPWAALTGWLDDEPIDDIDEVIYRVNT